MQPAKSLIYLMSSIILASLIVTAGAQSTSSQTDNLQTPKSNQEKPPTQDEIHKQVKELLERAPVLSPRPSNALDEKRFIEEANKLLVHADWEVGKIETAVDAIAELEIWFSASPPVKAQVISNPTGLDVEYRKVVDTQGPFQNTTTDNVKLMVNPVLYKFICKNKNGEKKEQIIACTNGCTVKFEF